MKCLKSLCIALLIAGLLVSPMEAGKKEQKNCKQQIHIIPGDSETQFYLENVQDLDYSVIKFKDTLLDILLNHRQTKAAKPGDTLDNYVEKQSSGNLNFSRKKAKMSKVTLEDDLLNQNGLLGIRVDRLQPLQDCKADAEFVKQFPSEIFVLYKTNLAFLVRTGKKGTIVWCFHKDSLQPAKNTHVKILRNNTVSASGKCDDSGLFSTHTTLERNDWIIAHNKQTGAKALFQANHLAFPKPKTRDNIIIYPFTGRKLYKPGAAIHIGGIVKRLINGEIRDPGSGDVKIKLLDPDNKTAQSTSVKPDNWGGFRASFQTRDNAKKGNYKIQVIFKDTKAEHTVTIDYFQPDAIKAQIKDLEKIYNHHAVAKPVISGHYLSGVPMSGDRVSIRLTAVENLNPSSFLPPHLENYHFNLHPAFWKKSAKPKPQTLGMNLDALGQCRPSIDLQPFKQYNRLLGLSLEGRCISKEGKEVKTGDSFLYFPGSRAVGIDICHIINRGEPVDAHLIVVDSIGRPASGRVTVTLYKEKQPRYYYNGRPPVIDTRPGIQSFQSRTRKIKTFPSITIKGKHIFRFPVQKTGVYWLRCDVVDKNGKTLSASRPFQVSEDNRINPHTLKIKLSKTHYTPGEKLRFTIRTPKTGKALVTLESHRIIHSFMLGIRGITTHELIVPSCNQSRININVVALYHDRTFDNATVAVKLENPEKKLTIKLEPRSDELRPGAGASLKVKVTDRSRSRQKAKVFVYAVNEGNLQLSGYSLPVPFQAFHLNPKPILTHRYLTLFSPRRLSWPYLQERFRQFNSTVQPRSIPAYRWQLPLLGVGNITGTIKLDDGSSIPGVTVQLTGIDSFPSYKRTTVSNENGLYRFISVPTGLYEISFFLEGFKSQKRKIFVLDGNTLKLDVILELGKIHEAIYVTGKSPTIDIRKSDSSSSFSRGSLPSGGGLFSRSRKTYRISPMLDYRPASQASHIDPAQFQSLIRKDFKELLFFKVLETDENGVAHLDFKTSDMISTYRVIAVAYNHDAFGSGETQVKVTKDVYIEEAMPEFARKGDRFEAGLRVANRSRKKQAVTVAVQSRNIRVGGRKNHTLELKPRQHQYVNYPFHASKVGEASVKFYAAARSRKDALLKKLNVTHRHFRNTDLYFDMGAIINRQISLPEDAENGRLSIKVSPFILKTAGQVARKLVFYSYECLEQRTSRAMPYLILDEQIQQQLGWGVNLEQARESLEGYLKIIPRYMRSDGALSYYPGDGRGNNYLTLYVYWAMHLAKEKNLPVDPKLVKKVGNYLKNTRFSPENQCFLQFIRSLHKKAHESRLRKLYEQVDKISLMGQVFLYRAVNNQLKDSHMLEQLRTRLEKHVRVEPGNTAYVEVGNASSSSHFPFYSRRFATAFLLQALLEVEGKHILVTPMIHKLFKAEPRRWNTTQETFWILYAMKEIHRRMPALSRDVSTSLFIDGKEHPFKLTPKKNLLEIKDRPIEIGESVHIRLEASQPVYLTTTLQYDSETGKKIERGINVSRNIYDESGQPVSRFERGRTYMVELLLSSRSGVPYAVVDEPLAAGFEVVRQDLETSRKLNPFNRQNEKNHSTPWCRPQHSADRIVFYTYKIPSKTRFCYYIKALYSGTFNWMPTHAEAMYKPNIYGRCQSKTITVH